MDTTKKTALVTGASGGIGYELAKLFAADGHDLVLVARSEQKLNDFATDLGQTFGIKATVLAKDLSDPAAPDQISAALRAKAITVDILVNNAGYAIYGPFAETDFAEELNMIQLNAVTLTHLTKLFLPGMIERGSGRILNVASTAAFVPVYLMSVYGATKAYVLSLSEAIALELAGTGVTMTTLCPHATRTEFAARANVQNIRLHRGHVMSAERVAEIGYKALMRGQCTVIPGLRNRLMMRLLPFVTPFIPSSLFERYGRSLMEPVGS